MTELGVSVDPASPEAPYEQVRTQVEALIRAGRLVPGDRLPTVRALAAELTLAVNTVARAYKQLEAAGLVETHSRAGTTVAAGAHSVEVALGTLASRFVTASREAGVGDAEALEIVRRAQQR